MNVKLITVGKTSASYLREGELEYQNRLKHYMKFERIDIVDLKVSQKISPNEVKKKEAEFILKQLHPKPMLKINFTSSNLFQQFCGGFTTTISRN